MLNRDFNMAKAITAQMGAVNQPRKGWLARLVGWRWPSILDL